MQLIGRDINLIRVDLALIVFLRELDTVFLQCQPVIFGSHNLSQHIVPISMRSEYPFMDLYYNASGF